MIVTPQQEKQYGIKSFILKYKCASPPPDKWLTSPEEVVKTTRALFDTLDGGASVEHFGVWFLNVQNQIIGFKAFNTGTVDQVAAYPRLIIHTALMLSASGLVLVHNHPSGEITPSEEDKRLTFSLQSAAKLFDIRIADHVIIGANAHYSFVQMGLI